MHNHGPAEGPGLACPEVRLPGGSRVGACVARSRELCRVSVSVMGRPLVDGVTVSDAIRALEVLELYPPRPGDGADWDLSHELREQAAADGEVDW